ncbi:lipocalin family protein [Gramella sp. AN32]|uniref:Type IV secretion system putative lipoprotein virB7 n=1 Tax=Christiangramia antarctica TaxID=2058158 RepID=A0ABW5XAM0_9FLAO|nr:lipocalin family protein [Gramella sp. AN32]MCM4154503.1 hypothetical protein [Gramella sp. AN32]
MKKIFLLLVSLSVLTSCSDDDDSSKDGNIVGTWFLVEANNAPGYTIDDCTSQSNITFNADNTATSEFYANTESGCDFDPGSGGWSKDGNQYTFAIPLYGDVTGTVTFNSDTRFTFVPSIPGLNASLVFEK